MYHHVLKCERLRGDLLHLISQPKSTPRTRLVNAEQRISLLDGVVESHSANSGGARTSNSWSCKESPRNRRVTELVDDLRLVFQR